MVRSDTASSRTVVLRAVVQGALTLAVVAIVLVVSAYVVESERAAMFVSDFGLLGVFIVASLSGFNVVVPIPAVAFFPLFFGAGLSFWSVVLTATLGMTIGDTVGYLIGSVGRGVAEARARAARDGRVYRFLESFRTRNRAWPYVLLALYISFVPAPNEILVIPMAFAGYRLRYMLPLIFAGNLTFNTLAALGLSGLVGFF